MVNSCTGCHEWRIKEDREQQNIPALISYPKNHFYSQSGDKWLVPSRLSFTLGLNDETTVVLHF